MSEEWEFYPLLVDDSPASIFFDLGIRSEAPLAGYNWLGYLRVRMRQPRPDGLSSGEESDALAALEDGICASVTASDDTIYVGRNTSDGNRDFYFYTRTKSFFEKTASAAMLHFPDYEFEVGSRPDEAWDAYFRFLYPSARSMQLIKNRRVCDALQSHGDQLTTPRDIDHRVYFHTSPEAEKFAEWLRQNDFEITTLEPLEGDPSRIVVDFVRKDLPNDIDPVVLAVLDNAADLNGDYDGWGCEVQAKSSE